MSGVAAQDVDAYVTGAVVRVVARVAPRGVGPVVPEAELLADLAFQSLMIVELGFALQDLFDVSVSPEDAMGLSSVADVAGLVALRLREGRARLPEPAELDQWLASYAEDDE